MIEVALLGKCEAESCRRLAVAEYNLLSKTQYMKGVSIRPDGIASGRTFIRRYTEAVYKGYSAGRVVERSNFRPEILAINESLPERQGRPMDPAYRDPSVGDLPLSPCPEHDIAWYGVFSPVGELVGYATIYHVHELTHVSQFLVHGEHLGNHAAYLLMWQVIEQGAKPGVVFYNRHDSGTDGLRFFKERCGFREEDVQWKL